ncbi:MAG TPA: D-2-hydroxyacid dehydrogenase [Candidatus Saccharimonadales bacterium]|nr:D-2-hydroxyacid dehydrogenase [Candidatus Saccharimonadales bacterium]
MKPEPPRIEAGGPIRVLIAYSMMAPLRASFQALGSRFQIEFRTIEDRPGIDALDDPELEVLIASFPPRDRRRTPRLRWLQLASAGVDHLIEEAPWSSGLTVTNARGVYGPSIGQYVLSEILRINEHTDERRVLQLAHRWADGALQEHLTGRLLRGQTAVVVGYGGVGRELARLLDALGMRVIAVKNRPEVREDQSYHVPGTGDPTGVIPERIVGLDELPAVIPLAGVVVLTIPLTTASRGLFNAGLIAAMRPDAWLVNIGRGPVADETALASALAGRRIGGAVLDVFGTEPLPPDSPFWDAPNTVVTPHVSGGDASSPHILADLLTENLRRYAAGEPLLNVVDPVRQY